MFFYYSDKFLKQKIKCYYGIDRYLAYPAYHALFITLKSLDVNICKCLAFPVLKHDTLDEATVTFSFTLR